MALTSYWSENMPALQALQALQDEETRPHSHLEDFIFRRQTLQVWTQMSKITYGNQCATVCEQHLNEDWTMLLLIIQSKCSLKWHVFMSNWQSRVWSEERNALTISLPTHCSLRKKRILQNNNGKKRRVAWALSALQWLPEKLAKPQWHRGRFICLFCSLSNLFESFIFFKLQQNRETKKHVFFSLHIAM